MHSDRHFIFRPLSNVKCVMLNSNMLMNAKIISLLTEIKITIQQRYGFYPKD